MSDTTTSSNPLGGRDQLRQLRIALASYAKPSWWPSLFWVAFDLSAYGLLLHTVVSSTTRWQQIFASLLLGLFSARLFILGHDACHQALTPSSKANKLLGRILFLPTLTPYLGWELGHNVIHHSFTNLRGKDFVWVPPSRSEWLEQSLTRRILTELYRNPIGLLFYYLIEIWFPRLITNRGGISRSQPLLFLTDRCLAMLVPLGIAAICRGPLDFLLAFVIPFLVWNWLMSFVVLVHHSHPELPWYDSKSEWSDSTYQANVCVDVQLPSWASSILHNVLIHSPHHVNTSIPFHRLPEAQRAIWRAIPGKQLSPRLTFSYLLGILRDCRIFDSGASGWESI